MVSTIGIKIANGEFYPIFEENSTTKKRLILTTVHNKQKSIHIDLYKSATQSITDALFIGSLAVEHINSKPKGEPSIELTISSNQNGDIFMDAVDLDPSSKAEHHYLQVSSHTLGKNNRAQAPSDFEIDYQSSPPLGLYEKTSEKKSVSWLFFIALGIIGICLILWLFLFNGREHISTFGAILVRAKPPVSTPDSAESSIPPKPVLPMESAPTAEPDVSPPPKTAPDRVAEIVPESKGIDIEPEPIPESKEAVKQEPAIPTPPPAVPLPKEPLIIEAPASPPPRQTGLKRIRPSPPVASYKVPTTIPRGGVTYKIRWGDTLWDISEAFYRNPWLYRRIARFNNIRNPDLIISGKTIRIPPRK